MKKANDVTTGRAISINQPYVEDILRGKKNVLQKSAVAYIYMPQFDLEARVLKKDETCARLSTARSYRGFS